MPLDPFLEGHLASLPDATDAIDSPAYRMVERRLSDTMFARVGQAGPDVRSRRRWSIPAAGADVDVLVYTPVGEGPHPAHVFLHGGGWVLGSIDHAIVDATCRERCAGAGCVVVSVGYRKAPEHRFPGPLDDAYRALCWLSERAEELLVDPDAITVGGQSAGGNLAAALALKARDEGGPSIALQLLEIPALDLTLRRRSHHELASGYGLTLLDMERFRDAYLSDPREAVDPYASPALAPDLSDLPPTHIMTAEFDLLKDDGHAYAKGLDRAGVPVTLSMHRGHIHGSGGFTKAMPSARAWRQELVDTLRGAHAGQPK